MRQPCVGRIGAIVPAIGETTPETWLQAALPQTSEDRPPATVTRKRPRPYLRGSSGIQRKSTPAGGGWIQPASAGGAA